MITEPITQDSYRRVWREFVEQLRRLSFGDGLTKEDKNRIEGIIAELRIMIDKNAAEEKP